MTPKERAAQIARIRCMGCDCRLCQTSHGASPCAGCQDLAEQLEEVIASALSKPPSEQAKPTRAAPRRDTSFEREWLESNEYRLSQRVEQLEAELAALKAHPEVAALSEPQRRTNDDDVTRRDSLASNEAPQPAPTDRYHDSGLPLETEVYGFLDALDVTWSAFEVSALVHFIEGRINAAKTIAVAMVERPVPDTKGSDQ